MSPKNRSLLKSHARKKRPTNEIQTRTGQRSDVAEMALLALVEGPIDWSTKTPRGYCVDGKGLHPSIKMVLAERRLVRMGRGADPTRPTVRCMCITDEGRAFAERVRERRAKEQALKAEKTEEAQ